MPAAGEQSTCVRKRYPVMPARVPIEQLCLRQATCLPSIGGGFCLRQRLCLRQAMKSSGAAGNYACSRLITGLKPLHTCRHARHRWKGSALAHIPLLRRAIFRSLRQSLRLLVTAGTRAYGTHGLIHQQLVADV